MKLQIWLGMDKESYLVYNTVSYWVYNNFDLECKKVLIKIHYLNKTTAMFAITNALLNCKNNFEELYS
jgi:hypothetical protein